MEEKIKLHSVHVTRDENGEYPQGFEIKRQLTSREVLFLLKKVLGLSINHQKDYTDAETYEDYRDLLTTDVNDWLVGKASDADILAYDVDKVRESFSLFQHLALVSYLQKKKIIR